MVAPSLIHVGKHLFRFLPLLILFAALPAQAAVFTPGCDVGNLAADITTANGNNEADTINLDGACTYTLSTTLAIAADNGNILTINGNGAIISGNNAVQVFNIVFGANIALNNLTIRNGDIPGGAGNGGGINNQGTVTISNSTITNNSAGFSGGAIYNQFGTVTLNNSTVSNNSAGSFGGGILNAGTVNITNNTTISNNSAGDSGGGIYNSDTVTITNSTITNNSAGGGIGGGGMYNNSGTATITNSRVSGNSGSSGAGVYNISLDAILNINSSVFSNNPASSNGGGIFNNSGTVGIGNSTFSGNSATDAGALFNSGGTTTLTNSTLSGNTAGSNGGIRSIGTVNLRNSIVVGNPGGDCSGTINDGGFPNLGCGGSVTGNAQLGSFNGTYFPLQIGSAAIDTGDNTICPSTDQIGATRPFNGGIGAICDLGAIEAQFVSSVLSINDVTLNEGNSGTTTFTFTVSLSLPAGAGGVTFDIATADDTATSAAGDYVANALTGQSIPAGSSSYNFDVTVNGDAQFENSETFFVNVTNVVGAFVGDVQGVGTISNDDIAGISITPTTLTGSEGSNLSYQIQFSSVPSGAVTIEVAFDPAEVAVNGGDVSPVTLTFTDTAPQTIAVFVLHNLDENSGRSSVITHAISASTAPEYPAGMALPNVTVNIDDVPPPPPTPLCEDHNFDEGGVVRASTADALGYAINCRVLYQNGHPTQWLGGNLYNSGSIGIQGIFDLGVQQAVDIFSPVGMTYFEGGAVFCLRGEGTLIWLAASGSPRHPEIIGSYTVDDFPGFTCATLFEPGTLVLVRENPME